MASCLLACRNDVKELLYAVHIKRLPPPLRSKYLLTGRTPHCDLCSYLFLFHCKALSEMLHHSSWAWACLLLFGKPGLSKPMPSPVAQAVQPSTTVTPGGSACGQNNATNRACWKNNWNINTDYETTTPPGTTKSVRYKNPILECDTAH